MEADGGVFQDTPLSFFDMWYYYKLALPYGSHTNNKGW